MRLPIAGLKGVPLARGLVFATTHVDLALESSDTSTGSKHQFLRGSENVPIGL